MSKPLELTIYPKWNGYYRGADGLPVANSRAVDAWSSYKRLTEAELAAEYHAAWSNMLDVPKGERYPYEPGRIATLHRFASLPHYDQEQP